MSRIADLAQNRLVQSTILNTQDRIAKNQLQISTLQKSQNYAGISDQSARLVSLEVSETRISQFLTDNTFVQLRMDTMLNSTDSLKTTLNDIKGLLSDILEDGNLPDGVVKDDVVDIKIAEIEDFMNTRVNGRYIFSGSKTDVKPVQPGDMTNPATISFDANFDTTPEPSFYYQGDETQVKARIDEGVVLDYGVNAGEAAFEKLIRATRVLRATPIDGSDTDYIAKMQNALNLIIDAKEDLQATDLNIGTKIQQLGSTNTSLEQSKNFFDGIISNIESANTCEAVAELTRDQTMLEASYNTVVRLSSLSLTSFL